MKTATVNIVAIILLPVVGFGFLAYFFSEAAKLGWESAKELDKSLGDD